MAVVDESSKDAEPHVAPFQDDAAASACAAKGGLACGESTCVSAHDGDCPPASWTSALATCLGRPSPVFSGSGTVLITNCAGYDILVLAFTDSSNRYYYDHATGLFVGGTGLNWDGTSSCLFGPSCFVEPVGCSSKTTLCVPLSDAGEGGGPD
jgi:hypothetical protein